MMIISCIEDYARHRSSELTDEDIEVICFFPKFTCKFLKVSLKRALADNHDILNLLICLRQNFYISLFVRNVNTSITYRLKALFLNEKFILSIWTP